MIGRCGNRQPGSTRRSAAASNGSVSIDQSKQRARERAAGLLLIVAAGVALGIANSPLYEAYHQALEWQLGPVLPRLGQPSLH